MEVHTPSEFGRYRRVVRWSSRGLQWTIDAVLLFGLSGTMGCDPPGPGGKRVRPATVRIAVIGESRSDPTWPVIESTARWAEDLERNATIVPMAPDARSPTAQRAMLRDLLDSDFDAVAVFPTDPASIRQTVKLLVDAGKPVLTFGRDVVNSGRLAFFGPGQEEMGRAAAEACAAVLSGGPTSMILLSAGASDEQYAPRLRGFRRAARTSLELEVLREVQCDGKVLDAARLVRAEARLFPRVGGWVFLDDWPLRGLADDARLVPPNCKVVVCDGSPAYFDRLRRGELHALIGHDFGSVVEKVIFATVRAAHGVDIEVIGETLPPEIITIRNLDVPGGHAERWAAWSARDGR